MDKKQTKVLWMSLSFTAVLFLAFTALSRIFNWNITAWLITGSYLLSGLFLLTEGKVKNLLHSIRKAKVPKGKMLFHSFSAVFGAILIIFGIQNLLSSGGLYQSLTYSPLILSIVIISILFAMIELFVD